MHHFNKRSLLFTFQASELLNSSKPTCSAASKFASKCITLGCHENSKAKTESNRIDLGPITIETLNQRLTFLADGIRATVHSFRIIKLQSGHRDLVLTNFYFQSLITRVKVINFTIPSVKIKIF